MEISTNKQTETVAATQEKLSLKEKVSYGFGDFGNGFMFDLGQLYLLKFFTDVAGIPAAAAGGIFLVSKLFAAFVDPIVGTSIDYRKNIGPKGKFRPYLLYGSFVLAILTILTFISPNLSPTGKLIYAYASYMLFLCKHPLRFARGSHDAKLGGTDFTCFLSTGRLTGRPVCDEHCCHPDDCQV